ncbi:MAG TPA: M20/M25/M40 family metallo-hydrolase [Longimicrobiales bacterium]|nr:M20/M25/M40 family metallo-hydrolase [Longimicrobiales bacterium]
MHLRRFIFLAAFPFAACAAAPAVQTPLPPSSRDGVDAAVATITVPDVQRHIEFLASDELQGRDTPSPGLERAAAYIAAEFRSFGLQPAGDSGTYIQRFPYTESSIDIAAARVQARARGTATDAAFGRDYFMIPAAIDSIVGTPVFAGSARPGVAAPAEAAGRILFYYVPGMMGAEWQQAASAALQASFGAGAGAVVLVLDSTFARSVIATLADELSGQQVPMPVIGIAFDVARGIVQLAGLDLHALVARSDAAAAPLTGVTLAIRTPITSSTARVPNVVAILPGSDPALRDEYIVFSAHMDHVGIGAPDASGDSIYNGADDDASGTSAVLEIAQAFASLERSPARSIVFVLVSGEEKGLLGSAHFVEQPPVPAARMVANINMDMIGRNAPDTVVAIGQDYSSLGVTIQGISAAHRELGLVVAPDLWPEEQLFFRSDHFSFAAQEIPAIFFTTGLHDDYHQPSDEAHTIDNDKVTRIARLLFRFGHELASSPARPQWTPAGLAEVRRATGGR